MEKCHLRKQIPHDSQIAIKQQNPYFKDSYEIRLFYKTFNSTDLFYKVIINAQQSFMKPLWVIRIAIAPLLNIKISPRPVRKTPVVVRPFTLAQKQGLFTVIHISETEILLAEKDTHLNVWLSVQNIKQDQHDFVVIATLVDLKNFIGRLYMWLTLPFHKPHVITRLNKTKQARIISYVKYY